MREFLRIFSSLVLCSPLTGGHGRVRRYLAAIHYCQGRRWRLLGEVLVKRLQRRHGVYLRYSTAFDGTLDLPHPVGIVIGSGVRLGRCVKIFQNVTIGAAVSGIEAYPTIGDHVTIYAGAVVLGAIHVGNHCIVGANSTVIHDVPDNSVVVGSPARVIRTRGS